MWRSLQVMLRLCTRCCWAASWTKAARDSGASRGKSCAHWRTTASLRFLFLLMRGWWFVVYKYLNIVDYWRNSLVFVWKGDFYISEFVVVKNDLVWRFCAESNKSVICFASASVLLYWSRLVLTVVHTQTLSLSLHSLWSFPVFDYISECPNNLWSPVRAAYKCMLNPPTSPW